MLRTYAAAAIATTWPEEAFPPGVYYPKQLPRTSVDQRIESSQLGDMLAAIETTIRRLQPQDAMHRKLADDSLNEARQLVQRRWKLIEEASSSISSSLFYLVLVFWLAVVFAAFGLCAPRNLLVFVMLTMGALSIASAILVILVYDTPFGGGWFSAPSEPLRAALRHISQ